MSTYWSHNLSPNLTKKYNDLLDMFLNSQKRPADEELSPCHRRKVKKSNRAVEIVTGVGSDGLPFTNPENGIAKNFCRLPVVRKLDWRLDATGNPIMRELKDGIGLVAAFGQTRGEEALKPCSFCRTGKGPWVSCVIIADPLNPDAKHNGYCSNCWYSRRYPCSLLPLVPSDTEEEVPIIHDPDDDKDPNYEPATTAASSLMDNDGSDDDDLLLSTDLGNDTVRKSALSTRRALKSTGTFQKNKGALSKICVPSQGQMLPTSKAVKQELQSDCFKGTMGDVSTTPTANSSPITILPLKIKKTSSSVMLARQVAVPFPLDADVFDNLEFLKLAEQDMLGHIDKVRKRIKVLEAQKMEHHDPWAYV